MKKEDLELLEADVMEEVVKRRKLGGYSAEAAGLLFLAESLLKIVRHLNEAIPANKKKKE
jgi:hypothetical protein